MLLVTKDNVSVELLKKIIGGAADRVEVSEKFLLQTSRGIHTAELRGRGNGSTGYLVRHIFNSPYAIIRKGSSSSYIVGSITELVNTIKNEDYDFFTRRQPQ